MPSSSRFRTSRSVRTVASPARLLALIGDASTWPDWQPEILSAAGARELAPGDSVLGDAKMLGFRVAGRADITNVGPSSLEQDVIVGIRMKVRYEAAPAGDGAFLTHTLEAEMPTGVSGRVLALFLRYRLRRMQTKLLENLAGTIPGSS